MSAYYYLDSTNTARGPFSLAELWSLLEHGVVHRDASVNASGEVWNPLHTYPELACHLSEWSVAQKRPAREMFWCVVLTLFIPLAGLCLGIIDAFRPPPRRSQGGVLLAAAVLSIMVGSLIFGWMRFGGAKPPAPAPLLARLPKWEYKIAAPKDETFEAEMAAWGREGWELVSAGRASGGETHEVILKRAK